MKNLADHLVDILENSYNAGSLETEVTLGFNSPGRFFWEVRDKGRGFPGGDLTDPFLTGRSERKVGMGLSLLAETAGQTNGSLRMETCPGGGSRLFFETDMRSVDARPLGDIARALVDAARFWPEMNLRVFLAGENPAPVIDTARLRAEVGEDVLEYRETRECVLSELKARLLEVGIDTQFGVP